MEGHFLKDFVSDISERGGTPTPWYNRDGDCIIYQTTDEAIVADRIDEWLTIYRSVETTKAIGYQIKGVAAIVNRFGLDGIAVEWSQKKDELTSVSMYSLLLAAYDMEPKTIGRRRGYADAFQSAGNHPRVQLNDLPALGLACHD